MKPHPKQSSMFAPSPAVQAALMLDCGAEAAAEATRARFLAADATALVSRTLEAARLARAAAAGGEREYEIVSAINLLEAASIALTNAARLLAPTADSLKGT